jgi:amino acid permease
MDVMTLSNLIQISLAIIGLIVSAIWFINDKRRKRYSSFLWGMWCILLAIYKLYHWSNPSGLSLHSSFEFSFENLIFTLGIISIIFIGVSNILEEYKYGFK